MLQSVRAAFVGVARTSRHKYNNSLWPISHQFDAGIGPLTLFRSYTDGQRGVARALTLRASTCIRCSGSVVRVELRSRRLGGRPAWRVTRPGAGEAHSTRP